MIDLKYVGAYLVPLMALLGLYLGGWFSYLCLFFAFGIIPIFDELVPKTDNYKSRSEKEERLKNQFFDILLYINVPIVYGLLFYFIYWLNLGTHETYEYVGQILSIGTVLGANGINVAHELGHRMNIRERVMAQLLLLPSFYMHFIIEHNMGHHKYVSTPEDPSTARYNENIYFFWVRSTFQSYFSAWKLEAKKLRRDGIKFFSIKNKMIWFTIIQSLYISTIFYFVGLNNTLVIVLAGIFGFLLLETINYIEHYGLVRNKTKSGGYERVLPKHSWNSNHEIGRIMLYELTRHSDHHFLSAKKYQTLDNHEEAPQLPMGYPASMLMSLIPPLWFSVMNKRLKAIGSA